MFKRLAKYIFNLRGKFILLSLLFALAALPVFATNPDSTLHYLTDAELNTRICNVQYILYKTDKGYVDRFADAMTRANAGGSYTAVDRRAIAARARLHELLTEKKRRAVCRTSKASLAKV